MQLRHTWVIAALIAASACWAPATLAAAEPRPGAIIAAVSKLKPGELASEQDWMLLRLEECPHLTVRGLAVELAERGYRVSPNTVWSLLRKAGHSFKKKPVRQRAGSSPDRAAAGAVEEVSGPA